MKVLQRRSTVMLILVNRGGKLSVYNSRDMKG